MNDATLVYVNHLSNDGEPIPGQGCWPIDDERLHVLLQDVTERYPHWNWFLTVAVRYSHESANTWSTDIWPEPVVVTHKANQVRGTIPVCWGSTTRDMSGVCSTNDIDLIDCIDCLRRLAKDAVLYGRDRRPRRGW